MATKEVGFSIDISTKGGVVFTDTVYYLVDFESEILPDRESAEDDLRKQLSSFTLYGELKNYSPFLIKVIASKPIDMLRLHIYRVKNKKKCEIDYSDINNAASSFEKAYDYLKKRPQEIEHFRKITSSALKVWRDNIARKDEQNGKVNEQVLASLYYNIAVYYTLVRDYQTASEYFRLSDQTVVGFADALRLSTLSNTWGNAQEAYRKRME